MKLGDFVTMWRLVCAMSGRVEAVCWAMLGYVDALE